MNGLVGTTLRGLSRQATRNGFKVSKYLSLKG